MSKPESFGTSSANQTSPVLSFNAKPPVGIARRAGRSPSAARKLPKRKPRSPRGMVGSGKPLRATPWEWGYTTSPAGSSGGSAEGASEGRQPLTGPHLPPAAQAAQTTEKGKLPCPQGTQTASQRTNLALLSSERQPQPKLCRPPRRRPKQQKKESSRARRAHKSPFKGQALFSCLETPAAKNSRPPRR